VCAPVALDTPARGRSSATLDGVIEATVGVNASVRSEFGDPLAECFDPQGLFSRFLLTFDTSRTICLRFIDPYGNTVFNRAQAEVLARELSEIRNQLDEHTAGLFDSLVTLATRVASGLHLYLWFEGD
jgi:hypothetical protein